MIGRARPLLLFAGLCATACAGPPDAVVATWESIGEPPFPMLGERFGDWHVIVAEVFRSHGKVDEQLLRVRTVDGRSIDERCELHFELAPHAWASRATPTVRDGQVLVLEGYEAGAFRGLPRDASVWVSKNSDFGPPGARGFRFQRVFVIYELRSADEP